MNKIDIVWYVALGVNFACAGANLYALRTRHKVLMKQRAYWHGRFFDALPFVWMFARGPFKDAVDAGTRARAEALVPDGIRAEVETPPLDADDPETWVH